MDTGSPQCNDLVMQWISLDRCKETNKPTIELFESRKYKFIFNQ